MIRALFDGILKFGVPRTIMISEADKKIEEFGPKGVKVYALVGCLKSSGVPYETRRMAVVSARIYEGQWKISGASFGAPSAPFRGACPLKSP